MNKKFVIGIFLFLAIFLFGELLLFGVFIKKSGTGSGGEVKSSSTQQVNTQTFGEDSDFKGEKGKEVNFTNKEIKISSSEVGENKAHFFNAKLGEKTIYFFVVKDKNGIFRAAANACQVCFGAKKGFHQEGDFMVCNNCGNQYPLEKIATEKGGCNPVPINPNLMPQDGQIIIKQEDFRLASEIF